VRILKARRTKNCNAIATTGHESGLFCQWHFFFTRERFQVGSWRASLPYSLF